MSTAKLPRLDEPRKVVAPEPAGAEHIAFMVVPVIIILVNVL